MADDEGIPLKEYLDAQLAEMRRAVEVARQGDPPHVTMREHLEAVAIEREKAIQLALASADKLELERMGRAEDHSAAVERELHLTNTLSELAIAKAENQTEKRFAALGDRIQAIFEGLDKRLTALEGRTRFTRGEQKGRETQFAGAIAVAGWLTAVAAVVVAVVTNN